MEDGQAVKVSSDLYFVPSASRAGIYYRVWRELGTGLWYCSHAEQYGMPPVGIFCSHMRAVAEQEKADLELARVRAAASGFEEDPYGG